MIAKRGSRRRLREGNFALLRDWYAAFERAKSEKQSKRAARTAANRLTEKRYGIKTRQVERHRKAFEAGTPTLHIQLRKLDQLAQLAQRIDEVLTAAERKRYDAGGDLEDGDLTMELAAVAVERWRKRALAAESKSKTATVLVPGFDAYRDRPRR